MYTVRRYNVLGKLSNQDDDGNKNPIDFRIWQWKKVFARLAHAFFFFWRFEDVLVFTTTWNELFCSCVDDVSIWWQMLIFLFLCPKRWFQFISRIVKTHFSSIMTLSHWKMIAEARSYPGGGGLVYYCMKQTGMLVVSLRGCKFWILISLRVFRAKLQYFKPPKSRLGFRDETQNYAKRNRIQIFFFLLFFFIFKRSLLGVKICFSHAQIGLL